VLHSGSIVLYSCGFPDAAISSPSRAVVKLDVGVLAQLQLAGLELLNLCDLAFTTYYTLSKTNCAGDKPSDFLPLPSLHNVAWLAPLECINALKQALLPKLSKHVRPLTAPLEYGLVH
jgi:hypothetical protein